VGRTLSLFLVLATLIFTIVAALVLGIAASYAAVTSILFVFGHHSSQHAQPERKPTALIQSHASGD
jgi:hypothetical protein